jgi:hypothetical protein
MLAAGTVPTAHAQAPAAPGLPSLPPFSATARQGGNSQAQEGGQKEGQATPPPETVQAPVSASVGCAGCGNGGCCTPGRTRECCGCNRDTLAGRIFCGFYEELCCPDPCYDPKWIAAANAAFFVEGTRPVTTTRIRWEYGNDFRFPDRSEFFWGHIGIKGPAKAERSLNYSQLDLYQEVAAKGFSGFFEIPYLAVDPQINPFAAGFGDMKIGTKSLLFDRDLFQIGFMFTTYLPVGNVTRGLGTGHVSLEPSLLGTVKIAEDTFFQCQLSEWVPLGSDSNDQGSIFHFHFSLNHVLWRPAIDIQLIGTAELQGYSFQAGTFTDEAGVVQRSNGTTYISMGPGFRVVICEWLDLGFGAAFAVGDHGPDEVFRTEVRIRY